jgi:hypothetical protein
MTWHRMLILSVIALAIVGIAIEAVLGPGSSAGMGHGEGGSMFRGVRIWVVLHAMLHWAICGSAATFFLLILVTAHLLSFDTHFWLPVAGLVFSFLMGLVIGFWIGLTRERRRITSEGSEASP